MKAVDEMIEEIKKAEIINNKAVQDKIEAEKEIERINGDIDKTNKDIENLLHAIELLNNLSESTVGEAYRYITSKVNAVLSVAFKDKPRMVELKETQYKGQYPQLDVVLKTSDGIEQYLSSDTGHGIKQIISMIINICLIIISGQRRFLVIDEVLSGVDVTKREIIDELLHSFTEIGFQFIVSEHGFCSRGSQVYVFESKNGICNIKKTYEAEHGIYLQGDGKYSNKTRNFK